MKPILFNTQMVRAILDGRKSVTRRVVKFPRGWNPKFTGYIPDGDVLYGSNNIPAAKAPYRSGDILWVRETWNGDWCDHYIYKADGGSAKAAGYAAEPKWRPSIHMPREAARLFLRVTDVRVELLQDIDDDGAKAEGANYQDGKNVGWEEKMRRTAIDRFAEIWDNTIKPADRLRYGWEANPWVWVIEFERISNQPEGETDG